jgi:hypothetical protein
MNGKEYVKSFHYFDKRTSEEDMPVESEEVMQKQYEEMEILFEDFFDDNSLSLAKVENKDINMIYYFSKIQKKKETKKG